MTDDLAATSEDIRSWWRDAEAWALDLDKVAEVAKALLPFVEPSAGPEWERFTLRFLRGAPTGYLPPRALDQNGAQHIPGVDGSPV